MKWKNYCQCSLPLKFKQNMCVSIDLIKTSLVISVFTPVSPISKTEILSGKFYRIAEFYRIPDATG